jgi:NADPH2:quinone reductase
VRALRAHALGAVDSIRLDDVEPPVPGEGEVRVRVCAVAVSFVDLLVVEGRYQLRPEPPFVPGSEFAGVVDALGPGEAGALAVGDRVCGSRFLGAWAEEIVVPRRVVRRIGPDASFEQAAGLIMPGATALYALKERGGLRAGETVLVLGASGGVGRAAVQVARALRARVIAATGSPGKGDALIADGADAVLDVSAADWKDAAKALAGPGGVDVVFDPLGGDFSEPAFRTLGWKGRHLVVGFAGGGIPALRTNLALLKGAALVGVDLRQFGEREPQAHAALLDEVAALFAAGRLHPPVDEVFPVERHQRAFARVKDRSTTGRVVMSF